MSYIVGRWCDSAGEPRFAAWIDDEPGKMHELMRNWITTGATVEILDHVNANPRGLHGGGGYECITSIHRWRDHFDKQAKEQNT